MGKRKDFLLIFASYTIWGLLPAYWGFFPNVGATYLMSWKIISSAPFCLLIVGIRGKFTEYKEAVKDKQLCLRLFFASAMCAANFLACNYAYVNGRILDASLGNLLNPVASFFLSSLIYKEKTSNLQKAAMCIAVAGVAISIIAYGEIPVLSLIVSVSFSIYSVIKKKVTGLESIVSISIEQTMMFPFFLVVWIVCTRTQFAALASWQIPLLVLGGILTILPFLLFSAGIRGVPFKVLGFIQYWSSFLATVVALIKHESISQSKAITFVFAAVSAVIFAVGNAKSEGKKQE